MEEAGGAAQAAPQDTQKGTQEPGAPPAAAESKGSDAKLLHSYVGGRSEHRQGWN